MARSGLYGVGGDSGAAGLHLLLDGERAGHVHIQRLGLGVQGAQNGRSPGGSQRPCQSSDRVSPGLEGHVGHHRGGHAHAEVPQYLLPGGGADVVLMSSTAGWALRSASLMKWGGLLAVTPGI